MGFLAKNRRSTIFSNSVTSIQFLKHRLHGRGLKSTRFHDLETASKTTRFRGVYTEPIQPLNPTVDVKAISFRPLCFEQLELDLTKHEFAV